MTSSGRAFDDNKLGDWAVAYDEALAAGTSEVPDAPIELPELQAVKHCLDLLNARWPRARPASVEATPEAVSEPASRIGRFHIVGILGLGGNGIVFRAFDPLLRREVALKVPRPELLFDD